MSTYQNVVDHALAIFAPPYEELQPCEPETVEALRTVDDWRGLAVIWTLEPHYASLRNYEVLRNKPLGLPLIVLLPDPSLLPSILDMFPLVRSLSPRLILPSGLVDTPFRLRQALSATPLSAASALTSYLGRRGVIRHRRAIKEFHRMVDLARETRTVSTLARRMYTSRRSIGRHFAKSALPVPSHCLQFARLFHAALQIQSDDAAVFRIAARYGYTDGFTLSNQMKRLTGYRPSDIRGLLGWEWIVEAWLQREGIMAD